MPAEGNLRIFPRSSGAVLSVRPSLLETLCIEPSLLISGDMESRRKMEAYLNAAEDAWSSVYGKVLHRKRNFILWLRELLRETRESGVWVPSVFLKRLRQIERGDLKVYDAVGRVTIPLHAGLPSEFIKACELLGLEFPNIVPSLDGREYVDVSGRSSREINRFVERVVAAWREHPNGLGRVGLREWLREAISEEEE